MATRGGSIPGPLPDLSTGTYAGKAVERVGRTGKRMNRNGGGCEGVDLVAMVQGWCKCTSPFGSLHAPFLSLDLGQLKNLKVGASPRTFIVE